jgi:hypothetical protein
MPDVTEHEALEIAIEALDRECLRLAPSARDWQTYGDILQFNKAESRRAAETITRYERVIKVLEAMLWRAKEADQQDLG